MGLRNFNVLLNGSYQLAEQLCSTARRVRHLTDEGPSQSDQHETSRRPSSAGVVTRGQRGVQLLRPSSAQRWQLRHGQFGLVRTAWHGHQELAPESINTETDENFWL